MILMKDICDKKKIFEICFFRRFFIFSAFQICSVEKSADANVGVEANSFLGDVPNSSGSSKGMTSLNLVLPESSIFLPDTRNRDIISSCFSSL